MINDIFEKLRYQTLIHERLAAIKEGCTWEQIALALYQILDDIDTASDMCKEDYKAFQDVVMRMQARKNQFLFSPDGFSLQPCVDIDGEIDGETDGQVPTVLIPTRNADSLFLQLYNMTLPANPSMADGKVVTEIKDFSAKALEIKLSNFYTKQIGTLKKTFDYAKDKSVYKFMLLNNGTVIPYSSSGKYFITSRITKDQDKATEYDGIISKAGALYVYIDPATNTLVFPAQLIKKLTKSQLSSLQKLYGKYKITSLHAWDENKNYDVPVSSGEELIEILKKIPTLSTFVSKKDAEKEMKKFYKSRLGELGKTVVGADNHMFILTDGSTIPVDHEHMDTAADANVDIAHLDQVGTLRVYLNEVNHSLSIFAPKGYTRRQIGTLLAMQSRYNIHYVYTDKDITELGDGPSTYIKNKNALDYFLTYGTLDEAVATADPQKKLLAKFKTIVGTWEVSAFPGEPGYKFFILSDGKMIPVIYSHESLVAKAKVDWDELMASGISGGYVDPDTGEMNISGDRKLTNQQIATAVRMIIPKKVKEIIIDVAGKHTRKQIKSPKEAEYFLTYGTLDEAVATATRGGPLTRQLRDYYKERCEYNGKLVPSNWPGEEFIKFWMLPNGDHIVVHSSHQETLKPAGIGTYRPLECEGTFGGYIKTNQGEIGVEAAPNSKQIAKLVQWYVKYKPTLLVFEMGSKKLIKNVEEFKFYLQNPDMIQEHVDDEIKEAVEEAYQKDVTAEIDSEPNEGDYDRGGFDSKVVSKNDSSKYPPSGYPSSPRQKPPTAPELEEARREEGGWVHSNGEVEYLPNYSIGDHAKDAYAKLNPEKPLGLSISGILYKKAFTKYLKQGNIRFDKDSKEVAIMFEIIPTDSQMRSLGKLKKDVPDFYFDRVTGGHGLTWRDFIELIVKQKGTVPELVDSRTVLEKYKRVATDKIALLTNGVNLESVATLADEYGGRAQIGIDDGCYVLYLKEDDRYKPTFYIFPEAFETLRDLPRLKESLATHAERELKLAGLFDKDSDYEGMLGETVLELMEVFAKQGHSGFSAMLAVDLFGRLAKFETLTELTNNPEEWMDVTEISGPPTWQSRRTPNAFSSDGGKTYYDLDELAETYEDEEGVTYQTYGGKKVMHTSKAYMV